MKWPFRRKLNPTQPNIASNEGTFIPSRENVYNYKEKYENIEIVHRGVNMVIEDSALIPCKVGDKVKNVTPVTTALRKERLSTMLNIEPNPHQDINTFRRNIFTDLIVDGNAFIYFDGISIYHLPSTKISITPDPKTYIKYYEFEGDVKFFPNEIIHIKENSFSSIYRGVSRLRPATSTMKILESMKKFQNNFFDNGAVPGLVLKTDDTLSPKIKERYLASWKARFNPKNGGKTPMILDGGLSIDSYSLHNFKELDFQNAVTDCEKTILKAIGVPPVLLDGGNNANITPNLRLYYIETILPLVRKVNIAYSRFFGYEIWDDLVDIEALQKDLREQAAYFSTLVNGGILVSNEARVDLGREPIEGNDEIRIPANIAGSAVDPSTGGRPGDNND